MRRRRWRPRSRSGPSRPDLRTLASPPTTWKTWRRCSRPKYDPPKSKKRRQHSPDLKAKVGLEALKGIEPVHAIASRYEVHPVQVSQWKKEAVERLPEVFARKADHDAESAKERELFEEIGRLKMELEWLKKKAGELER